MKQPTQRELVIKLISEVREASRGKYDQDQPVCYPFVAGFLESVLKSLPENPDNYRCIQMNLRNK